MALKALPSPEVLRQLLRYEPETGKLFWLERDGSAFHGTLAAKAWNVKWAGKEAHTATGSHGYKYGNVRGRSVLAHRAIFAIVEGRWPESQIDHINGDRTDNRWANLREASHTQNCQNTKVRADSRSGMKGVRWNAKNRKWRARIQAEGSGVHLGYFSRKEDAVSAYAAAAEKLHGSFGRRP